MASQSSEFGKIKETGDTNSLISGILGSSSSQSLQSTIEGSHTSQATKIHVNNKNEKKSKNSSSADADAGTVTVTGTRPRNRLDKIFTDDDDIKLIRGILKYGKKWKQIWEEFNLTHINRMSLKDRARSKNFRVLLEMARKDPTVLDDPNCVANCANSYNNNSTNNARRNMPTAGVPPPFVPHYPDLQNIGIGNLYPASRRRHTTGNIITASNGNVATACYLSPGNNTSNKRSAYALYHSENTGTAKRNKKSNFTDIAQASSLSPPQSPSKQQSTNNENNNFIDTINHGEMISILTTPLKSRTGNTRKQISTHGNQIFDENNFNGDQPQATSNHIFQPQYTNNASLPGDALHNPIPPIPELFMNASITSTDYLLDDIFSFNGEQQQYGDPLQNRSLSILSTNTVSTLNTNASTSNNTSSNINNSNSNSMNVNNSPRWATANGICEDIKLVYDSFSTYTEV